MSEQFYTILTKIGKAKIANAAALGNQVDLVKFQIGDGNGSYYNPSEDQTQLKNKVWEGNISSIRIDEENPNWIVLETLIPGTDGGFMVREAAAVDNEGNLIAIGKYPETYKPVAGDGSIKDLIIKMIIEVANTSAVTLKVDPTVILATKNDILELDNKIKNIKLIDTKVKLTDPDGLFGFEGEANINQAILDTKTSIQEANTTLENLTDKVNKGQNLKMTHDDGRYVQIIGGNIDDLSLGWHNVFNATGTLPPGYTSNNNDFLIENKGVGVDWYRQILYDVRSYKKFERMRINGSWHEWREL